jgi:DNA-binding transcriptional regulator YdaS (Cro superfamily)
MLVCMKLSEYVNPKGAGAALAKVLKCSPVLISQWANGVRPVPSDRCIEIEKASDGAVTCEELRPDVDWGYLRKTEAAA